MHINDFATDPDKELVREARRRMRSGLLSATSRYDIMIKACMHVLGEVVASGPGRDDPALMTSLITHLPLYVEAYKQGDLPKT